MKKLFILTTLLICSVAQASEVTGNINTGGSNAVGNVNTGGSQSTSTATTSVSGTVIVSPISNFKSGMYVQPISVTLFAQNAHSINYTLDGSIPTCNTGNTFSAPISINSTTTLKAISCWGMAFTLFPTNSNTATSSGAGGGGAGGGFSCCKSSPVVTWQYDFRVPRNNQGTPTNGNLTLQGSSTQALITNQDTIVNLTVPSGVATPTVDVSTFITNGSGVLPEININGNNANGSIIKIPSGATVTSTSTSWDGIISAPVPRTITLPNPSGFTRSFSQAIQLGLTGSKLSFSKSVRLQLSGQAGKKAGWTRDDSTYNEITTICSADNQTLIDAQLGTDGDCKIDVGSDLVIWTKHFTTFVTYTETAVSTGGGGGGGGGGGSYVAPTVTTTTTTKATSTIISTPAIQTTNNLTTSNKFIFTKSIAQGSTGSEVLELQKLLVILGYLKATPNGNFGPATKQAVISFQIANKISPLGNVGPATRAVINKLGTIQTNSTQSQTISTSTAATSTSFIFVNTLQSGSRGSEVLSLQNLLSKLGLLSATPNGNFGPATKKAVMAFQKQNGILQTGITGPVTRAQLNKNN